MLTESRLLSVDRRSALFVEVRLSGSIPPAPFFLTTDLAERLRLYGELSRSGPVHRVVLPHGEQAWLVVRYEQARAALTDPRLAKVEPPFAGELDPALRSAINSNMLNVDLPEHTRLRRLVAAAFTRRRVERLAPRIQQLTDELLDPLVARAADCTFDLIAEFAYPLPVAVICELLGVPESGRESFRKWSAADVNASVIGLEAYTEAATAFVEYLHDLIALKRRHPGDDLTSALVGARDGSDQLSEDELTSMMYLLLVAGHETTVNLIANGVYMLLRKPGAWALLGSEPERVAGGQPGHHHPARRGAPRPDPLAQPACRVRSRHPSLSRGAVGPAGGADGIHQPARPLPRPATGCATGRDRC
jgi:cytochrome P450